MKKIRKLFIFVLIALMVITSCQSTKSVEVQNERTVYKSFTAPVLEVSKYGNVYLGVLCSYAQAVGYEAGDIVQVEVNDQMVTMPVGTSYSDVDVGSPLLKFDEKSGYVEIAINHGNFSKTYNAEIGTEITVYLIEKGGYADEYMIRHLEKFSTVEEAGSEVAFANFREVTAGDIKSGTMYRGCSPVYESEAERSITADKLIAQVGIKSVINLADNPSDVRAFSSQSPYYVSLLDEGQVVCLDMAVDFYTPEFNAALKKGLVFLGEHEAPFYIHCNEGKDRAGFVTALIEALCGATETEIIEDYMLSFENYFGVERGSEQYEAISRVAKSFIETIRMGQKNLEKGARRYASEVVGLSEEEIATLVNRLTK